MYKIELYVPESHLAAVKTAMFEAGAGRVGNYDCCAWQTRGEGQFRPLNGSTPFIGNQGQIETVIEYKLELVCEEPCLKAVIAALKRAHPYEEVAYTAIKAET
ncbi:MAG: NGG1p interacting factor NIF3 [Pseudomonadota bacterium]|nr:NGG1p interacting factor NIF3 [Pseudomonadota bacterium]MEC7997829.1 NGG1p interacting factor NIF3 [Pseudomonadota bacterium]